MPKPFYLPTVLFLTLALALSGCFWSSGPKLSYEIADLGETPYLEITPAADLVAFEANFNFNTCGKPKYKLIQEDNILTIEHHYKSTKCSDTPKQYGLTGQIKNLPPGDYILKVFSIARGLPDPLKHLSKPFSVE